MLDRLLLGEKLGRILWEVVRAREKAQGRRGSPASVVALDLDPCFADDDVFGRMARFYDANEVVINEHALHALSDFCSEVYDAWAKYQRRLAETEAAYRGSVF